MVQVHATVASLWLALVFATPAAGFVPLPRARAEDRQVDEAALAAALDAADQLGYVRGIVVARDGHVIAEEHFQGAETLLRQSRSVTKSVTSLLIGIAIDRGYFPDGMHSRMVDYLPAELVPADPDKAEIRMVHLLTMTSGLQWNETAEVVAWFDNPDPVREILDRPLASAPGASFNYSTAASHLLSVMLTEATGMSTLEFADNHLFGPLGITGRTWQVTGGYNNGGHGLYLRTEDLAKLGVLFLEGGRWAGDQVVPSWWVNASTLPIVHNVGAFGPLTQRHYGFLWWPGRGSDSNIYTAWGYGGQFIFCVPSLELVVAVHSSSEEIGWAFASQQEEAILDIIVDRIIPAATDRRVFTATGLDVPELRAVDEMVRDLMYEYEIRDTTAAITKDGRLVYARGFTLGEPEVEPVQPTALFRIGSIGKSVTSIAVHQQIEQGRLSYDTAVAATLDLRPMPGEQTDSRLEQVSLDHLLTHTSGMYSEDNVYAVNKKVAAALGVDPPATKEEISSYIVSYPFRFDPGTDGDYNNYGYIMLDLLTKHATGTQFVDSLLDTTFRPAGIGRARLSHMLRSELAPTEVDYDGHEGDPYTSIMEAGLGAGGLVMAAPDLARLYSVLFDDPNAGGLMSPATREQMLSLPFPISEQLGYGRGWFHEELLTTTMNQPVGSFTDPDDGLDVYGHGSGGSGTHHLALWRSDGIGFVLFTNKDPVADAVDFPDITVWPDHDLWQSVGVSLDTAGSAPTEAWIPVVASANGVGSSVWRSDLGLLNRSTLANRVRLRLYRPTGFRDYELELAPGEYRTIDDVMGSFGVTGSGPLRVFSSEPLTATSRTYNLAPTGTFGQYLGSLPHTQGLESDDSVVLMQLQENDSFRTNIGLTNGWKRPATVEIALYDGDGSHVTTISQQVPPEHTVQLNRPFAERGGRSDIDSGYALVTVGFGQHVVAYASVVDNATDDPTTIPMKAGTGSSHQWVAAAAHAPGANDSEWRTDLCLLNLSGRAASTELIFHGDDGQVATLPVALADGEQRLLVDVVDQMGSTGAGSIEIVSNQPVLITSRIYNTGPEGTFGQFLDGIPSDRTAREGRTVWLPQLQQNAAFRTNVGVLNPGTEQARVRIRLFDASGQQLASRQRSLDPGVRIQLQEPFSRIAGRDDLDAAYASVEVRAGDGVIAYASVTDNATNDPTTVPMMF